MIDVVAIRAAGIGLPHAILELDVVDLGVALGFEAGPHLRLGHAVLGERETGRADQRQSQQCRLFHVRLLLQWNRQSLRIASNVG